MRLVQVEFRRGDEIICALRCTEDKQTDVIERFNRDNRALRYYIIVKVIRD